MISGNSLVLTGSCRAYESRRCRAALHHHRCVLISASYRSHHVPEGAVGAEGLQGRRCTGGPGPPTDICWQSWGTWAVGGARRNFPSIVPYVCGCCLPPWSQRPVMTFSIAARMVGPHPGRSPCCTTGCRRQVLP